MTINRSALFRRRLGILAVTLHGALTLSACSAPPTDNTVVAPRPAYVVPVRTQADNGITFIGEVRAAARAEMAFPVSGQVKEVRVDVGDRVRRGQVLAVLDNRPLEAQFTATNGELDKARAQLAESRQRLSRVQAAANAASASEIGAAQLEVNVAESSLRAALANHAAATWSLAHTSLRAPFDGIVGQRALEPGQTVGPGAPVITVDGGGRELVVRLPESLPLASGSKVRLIHDGKTSESRVLRVGERLEAGGARQAIVALPDNAMVGATWAVEIDAEAASPSHLEIPLRAVLPAPEASRGSVLRLTADGQTVEAVAITLGAIRGEFIAIAGPLSGQDRIVVAGAAAITPGSRIKPVAVER
jgi:RND family efflux transporter MFP subunit